MIDQAEQDNASVRCRDDCTLVKKEGVIVMPDGSCLMGHAILWFQ